MSFLYFSRNVKIKSTRSFESDGLNSILDSDGLIGSIDFNRLDFYGRKDRF